MQQPPYYQWTPPTPPPAKQKTAGLSFLLALSIALLAGSIGMSIVDNNPIFMIFGLIPFVGMIGSGYTIYQRMRREDPAIVYRSDRFCIEFHLIVIIVATVVCGIIMYATIDAFYWYGSDMIFYMVLYLMIGVPVSLLAISSLKSVVRQFLFHRPKIVLEKLYRVIYRVAKRAGASLKEFAEQWLNGERFRQESFTKQMFARQTLYIGFLIAIGLVIFIFAIGWYGDLIGFGLLVALVAFVAATLWYLRGQNRQNDELLQLIQQIEEVAKGNFEYQPQVAPESALYETAYRLAGISYSFEGSVREQVKSERMKIELVTNVSHDLKTPLTSIISYVDLLSQEELSPEAEDYVKILAQKSERLKNIVADLFDLAKVTSGEADIEREVLDMSKLTVQTLADMEDVIEQSELQLRTNIVAPPVPILGDGKKLYRVLQNVVDNALKYSLKGTRIYLDLAVLDDVVTLAVKNTAEYEMTFTAEEIMERFVRGDESRTTEGNGLGLSIAKSFTEACGGHFQVEVDGDQFKVLVSFPLTNLPLPETAHDTAELERPIDETE